MDFEKLIIEWANEQAGTSYKPGEVTVEFGTIEGGGCETCWYEYPALMFSNGIEIRPTDELDLIALYNEIAVWARAQDGTVV